MSVAPFNGTKSIQDDGAGTRKLVSSEYKAMIETRDLTWEDTFFDGEQVVAVFDFDYDQMEVFNSQVAIAGQGSTMMMMTAYGFLIHPFAIAAVWGLYGLSCAPCLIHYQIQWEVRAQHVAITQDGIRFVRDKRKSLCGWSMCDKGKHSKTVPFDKITDCDIVEPAGNECLCIPRVLMKVIVDTASSSDTKHDLVITGLKDPHAFKQLVWAMKRSRMEGNYETPSKSAMEERSIAATSSSDGAVALLLKEIRDELRQNNDLLKKLHGEPGDTTTSEQEKQPVDTYSPEIV